MKSVVCVKQVPDTAAKVVAENGQVSWGDAPLVMNPWDEFAVEAAMLQQEAKGGSVTLISVGDESAKEALKHGLAMGCTEAILISDPALAKADSQMTAKVLGAAIKKLAESEPVHAVFFGRQAVDGDMGVTAGQTARALRWPALTLVSKITSLDPDSGKIQVERTMEEGRQVLESKLPAVVSVSKDIGDPRYPSFMGIRKASRATIPTWSLADLGLQAPERKTEWPEVYNPPAREVTCEIITGATPEEVAEKLADKILGEKVL